MIYLRGRYYWVKFKWLGKVVRKSTRASDLQTARVLARKIRVALAKSYARKMKVPGDPALLSALFKDMWSLKSAKKPVVKKAFPNLRIKQRQDQTFLESLGIEDPGEVD